MELPLDDLFLIMENLNYYDLINFCRINTKMLKLCRTPEVRRLIGRKVEEEVNAVIKYLKSLPEDNQFEVFIDTTIIEITNELKLNRFSVSELVLATYIKGLVGWKTYPRSPVVYWLDDSEMGIILRDMIKKGINLEKEIKENIQEWAENQLEELSDIEEELEELSEEY